MLNESGYNLMWMMVMFDLPVGLKKERKRATDFRNALLDMGFEMSQFSVYLRFVGNRERCKRYVKKVERVAPASGSISILFFTDKQFGQIINITKIDPFKREKKAEQLKLF